MRHGSTHPIPRCVSTHLRHGVVTAAPPGLRSVDQRLRSALWRGQEQRPPAAVGQ